MNKIWLLVFCIGLAGCDENTKKAVCPDGKAEGKEQCDGEDLRGAECYSLGYHGGTLACTEECTLDVTGCEAFGRCGDGVRQASHEDCDGEDLGNQTCAQLGLGGGELSCSANCTLDTSGCDIQPVCGDGLVQGAEQCDGENLAGATCESRGFGGGILTCDNQCRFVTTGCSPLPFCGDNVRDPDEECDGLDLGGHTCENLGYYGGTLACSSACTLDITSCQATGRCGDGTIQHWEGEQCDGANVAGVDCESQGYLGGIVGCTSECQLDFTGCGMNQAEIVCGRWNMDRSNMSEGTWTGSVAGCNAGDITGNGRANALKLINLYRFLVDLPPVTTDPALDAKAQECALMMTANGTLNHYPPASWNCYTADGAQAAGSSNLAGTAGVAAVDLYMVDPGNATTLGHRRWILSNSFGPTGLGSTNSYSCMWAFGSGNATKAWTAYPGPGVFPRQAVNPTWSSIDSTGWSLQSNSISLNNAQVTITMNGATPRPVTVTTLLANYGSTSAISMIPQGWTTQAGNTYHVEVTNISTPISYTVQVVDCSAY